MEPATAVPASLSQAMVDRASVDARGGRYVAEEDVLNERERWMQMCMKEVWRLENALSSAIQKQIEDATAKIKSDISQDWSKSLQADRGESEGMADAHREAIDRLSKSLDFRSAQHQADTSELQTRLDNTCLQMSALEAAVADLRSETLRLKERQDLQASSLISDVKLAQAIKEAGDKEYTAREALRPRPLCIVGRCELKHELDKLRTDLEETANVRADDQAGAASAADDLRREMSLQLDQTQRQLEDLQQDQVSETAMLKGRLDIDQEEHKTRIESLHLVVKEEQGRRAAEHAMLQARMEALEKNAKVPDHAAAAPPTLFSVSNDTLDRLTLRLEVAERQLDALAQRPSSSKDLPEIAALRARVQEFEGTFFKHKAAVASSILTKSTDEPSMSAMKQGLASVRGDVDRLCAELLEEKAERAKVFSDLGRLSEDMTKVVSSTVEHAKLQFAKEMQQKIKDGGHEDSRVESATRKIKDLAARSLSRDRAAIGTPAGDSDRSGSASRSGGQDDVRNALGSGVARLVGEMDAELRVELSSRMRLLTAELRGEILSEVAVKVASAEARAGVVEANLSAEVHRINASLSARLGKLEGDQLTTRVAVVESDVQRIMIALSTHFQGDMRLRRSSGKPYDPDITGSSIGSGEVVRCTSTSASASGANWPTIGSAISDAPGHFSASSSFSGYVGGEGGSYVQPPPASTRGASPARAGRDPGDSRRADSETKHLEFPEPPSAALKSSLESLVKTITQNNAFGNRSAAASQAKSHLAEEDRGRRLPQSPIGGVRMSPALPPGPRDRHLSSRQTSPPMEADGSRALSKPVPEARRTVGHSPLPASAPGSISASHHREASALVPGRRHSGDTVSASGPKPAGGANGTSPMAEVVAAISSPSANATVPLARVAERMGEKALSASGPTPISQRSHHAVVSATPQAVTAMTKVGGQQAVPGLSPQLAARRSLQQGTRGPVTPSSSSPVPARTITTPQVVVPCSTSVAGGKKVLSVAYPTVPR